MSNVGIVYYLELRSNPFETSTVALNKVLL